MMHRIRFSLSAVDLSVGVLFLLFTLVVIAFGRDDIGRVLAGTGTEQDVTSLFLLVGYGVSGLVLLWAGVAVVGDRPRRTLVARIVSAPLALVGTSLLAWAVAGAFRADSAKRFVLLAVALFAIVVEGAAAAMIGGLALRAVRRRIGDPLLVERSKHEGPTVSVLETLVERGATLAPFRVAFVAYRIGTVVMILVYASLSVMPVLLLDGVRIAWSRGDLRLWPLTLEPTLTLLIMLVLIPFMAGVLVISGRQTLQHLCIHRRMAQFPDGLEYAHRVVLQTDDAWLSVPPPHADMVADRLHVWSVRLMRVEKPLQTIALILSPVLFILAIILIVQGQAR
jgi:hypothetical protein